jgi:hypothetical protein
MVVAFAGEFFWKSVRDFRAWIGLVGLGAAGIGGAIGKPIILPTWVWLLIAFASAISMAIRAEWKAYWDSKAQIEPDMKLASRSLGNSVSALASAVHGDLSAYNLGHPFVFLTECALAGLFVLSRISFPRRILQ